MKINWGYRLAILYIGFVILIAYFVGRSVNEKIDLVTPDYYAQELKYQDKIESITRNNELEQPVSVDLTDSGITIGIPAIPEGKKVKGTILLFRPSDKSMDQSFDINVSPGKTQTIPLSGLLRGLYRVKVDYSIDGVRYFTEKQVVVNKD